MKKNRLITAYVIVNLAIFLGFFYSRYLLLIGADASNKIAWKLSLLRSVITIFLLNLVVWFLIKVKLIDLKKIIDK